MSEYGSTALISDCCIHRCLSVGVLQLKCATNLIFFLHLRGLSFELLLYEVRVLSVMIPLEICYSYDHSGRRSPDGIRLTMRSVSHGVHKSLIRVSSHAANQKPTNIDNKRPT